MRAMKKPSLSELFRRKAFDITRCVHLAVDLQKKFCTAAQAASRAQARFMNICRSTSQV